MTQPAFPGATAASEIERTPRRWIWAQSWFDMLFLHWRVPAEMLHGHVAKDLTIDEWDGDAWVSLVLFELKVRPAWLPYLPGFSNLVEVNLRTYVHHRHRPGITFLSVHAHNRLAIFLARRLTPMPYQWAAMSYQKMGNGFQFEGTDRTAAGFRMALRFQAGAALAETGEDTVEEWLLERYRLFLLDRHGRLLGAEVAHPRWQVEAVDVSMAANTAGHRFGLDLSRPADLAHFSPGVQSRFGAFGQPQNQCA